MKSTFDSMYVVDTKIASEGKWFPLGINDKGAEIKFLVAMAGNDRHQKAQRKYAKALEKTRWSSVKHRAIMARVVSEGLFLSWDGVLDENGDLVEPSMENRIKALIKYEDLFVEVLNIANDRANFSDDDETPLTEEEVSKLAEMDVDDVAMSPEEESEKNLDSA